MTSVFPIADAGADAQEGVTVVPYNGCDATWGLFRMDIDEGACFDTHTSAPNLITIA